MSSRIILSAPSDKELEDHERALGKSGLDGFTLEQFYALRAPWNPDNVARDELIPLGLVSLDYDRTELGEERLAAYWAARTYKPVPKVVDVVIDG